MVGKTYTNSHVEADINTKGETILIETKSFQGFFKSTFLMKCFPFDIQRLHLVIQSAKEDSEIAMLYKKRSNIEGIYQSLSQKGFILSCIYETKSLQESKQFSYFTMDKQGLEMTVYIRRELYAFMARYSFLCVLYVVVLFTLLFDQDLYKFARIEISLGVFWLTVISGYLAAKRNNLLTVTYQNVCFLITMYNNLFLVFYHFLGEHFFKILSNMGHNMKGLDMFILYLDISIVVSLQLFSLWVFTRQLRSKWSVFKHPRPFSRDK
ncbi:hypothetical protein HELRODRAFT_182247 [Helobdella robusta]|uniref:Uncharacterized protein n=1 Tax=Helobdella robusta TaxID=6412 RepID=T1FHZ7_HELRO|nr:hypothetical protein HELRODRAFT_182247 [Helobdella robusta]ESN91092.1 hypothetical protein HELRODRAFT_182247 [Helobdella robusta]